MHQPVDEPANERETMVPITEDWYVHGPLGKRERQDEPNEPNDVHEAINRAVRDWFKGMYCGGVDPEPTRLPYGQPLQPQALPQTRQDQPHQPRGSNFRRLLKSLRRSMALPWPGNDKGSE